MLEEALDNFNKGVRRLFKSRSVRLDLHRKRIHLGITCDYCGKVNFEGDRLCCTICDNYNLCSECFCLKNCNKQHTIDHPCLLLVHPSDNAPFSSAKLRDLADFYKDHDFNIVCNCCEKKIYGIYLKCNKCYCTYLCLECWGEKKQSECCNADEPHQMIVYKAKRLEKFDYKVGSKSAKYDQHSVNIQ